jgi:HAD superfamily hydrolase (TIGR01509 family)
METQHTMIQALIFDFDGIILETELSDFQSWQEIYQDYGGSLSLSTWLPSIGTGLSSRVFDPYEHLEAQLGKQLDREEILIRRRQGYIAIIEAQSLLPGVETIITDAEQRGLQLAVASSASREWVTGHLTRLEFAEHFDPIVCGDEVTRTKPFPDVYQAALTKLGIQPDQAIAFEDSPNGVRAAKQAGLFCIAVPNPLMQDISFEQADLCLTSLTDLPLESLLKRFS